MDRINDDIRRVYYDDLKLSILTQKGIKYSTETGNYYFSQDKQSYSVTIKADSISILNMNSNAVEHYVFTNQDSNVIFKHFSFQVGALKRVNVCESTVSYTDDHLYLKCTGVSLDTSNDYSCSNKIIYFSENVIGSDIFETLNNIQKIDVCDVIDIIDNPAINIDADDAVRKTMQTEKSIIMDLDSSLERFTKF